MSKYIKYKSKKKLGLIIASLCFVVVVLGVSIGVVLAATTQSLKTNVSVTYESKEVAGTVSATYQVLNETETAMKTADGDTEIVFTGAETTTDQGGSLSPENGQTINLTSTNKSVVFKYSFTNTGDADYVATVEENNTIKNLKKEISKDGTNYTEVEDVSLVVFNNTSTPEEYYVRYTIDNVAKNASADINFNWKLESIPDDTVALTNGVAYSDINDAFVDAVTDDAAPAGFTATRVADGGVNYQVVTIIKDVEITGTCPVDGRVLVVRAEKNVTITKTDDTVLGDISDDGELLLGLPYDTEEITYNSQVTGNLFEGTGNLTINNGVIDNTSNAAGTAINLSGEASKVTINGGTIKNFKVGVQLSDTTSLKLAGSFEGCTQTFAGTGILAPERTETKSGFVASPNF